MEKLRVELDRYTDSRNANIDRNLSIMLLGKTKILKCLKREEKPMTTSGSASSSAVAPQSSFQTWSITQWNDHIAARNIKVILELPSTSLLMDSQQNAGQVAFEFV